MKLIQSKLVAAFCFLFISTACYALPKSESVPGGIVIIPIQSETKTRPAVYFNQSPVAVVSNSKESPTKWHVILGLPHHLKPGQYELEVKESGKTKSYPFNVKDKFYPTQRLKIKNKRLVNPNPDDMARIKAEKTKRNLAYQVWSDQAEPNFILSMPVEGRISSPYGLKRFYNDQPRQPHLGIDIAAPEGTPIRAAASGKVVLSDHFFFNGNFVIIDHGLGFITLYSHLKKINVAVGDTIQKNHIIGEVGQTGRSTGPHLHWGVRLNNTAVNPLLFVP